MIEVGQPQDGATIVRLCFSLSHAGGLHCRSMGLRHKIGTASYTLFCRWNSRTSWCNRLLTPTTRSSTIVLYKGSRSWCKRLIATIDKIGTANSEYRLGDAISPQTD